MLRKVRRFQWQGFKARILVVLSVHNSSRLGINACRFFAGSLCDHQSCRAPSRSSRRLKTAARQQQEWLVATNYAHGNRFYPIGYLVGQQRHRPRKSIWNSSLDSKNYDWWEAVIQNSISTPSSIERCFINPRSILSFDIDQCESHHV